MKNGIAGGTSGSGSRAGDGQSGRVPALLLIWLVGCAWGLAAPAGVWGQGQRPQTNYVEAWLERSEAVVPRSAAEYLASPPEPCEEAFGAIRGWAELLAEFQGNEPAGQILKNVERLLQAKSRVDKQLEATLELRGGFAALPASEQRKQAVRSYLATTSGLIDLSGRLRFVLSEAITFAAYRFASQPALREELIDLLLRHRSSIGAEVMSLALFDPPPNSPNRAQPASLATKEKLLELIAVTGQRQLLPRLAAFVESDQTQPRLALAAAETIREVGLPQDERPGQDPTLPKPAITAARLAERLGRLGPGVLSAAEESRRQELLVWLDQRARRGLVEESYRLGAFEVRPGDWLLMRNPSPYNLFTDLSPGLFTHVGVVALEQGSDGKRRMVLVDLPERGREMQATNIDTFVERSLHYLVLRHPDPGVAETMGKRAAEAIGCATEFDLNFRTERVPELKGRPLEGASIRTYCAGLLLLCAQETSIVREEFFPLAEEVAAGKTAENLRRLGISIGREFISPTGALFSRQMTIAGRCEPMYDPGREIEEAIFDHFAAALERRELDVSTDFYQSLRMKLAEAAQGNPRLAQALAQAAGVASDVDLVAAARAAAVIETLDEIAYSNSGDFRAAQVALSWPGELSGLKEQGLTDEEIERVKKARARHAELARQIVEQQLTPRQVRYTLVREYVERGRRQIDERFFAGR